MSPGTQLDLGAFVFRRGRTSAARCGGIASRGRERCERLLIVLSLQPSVFESDWLQAAVSEIRKTAAGDLAGANFSAELSGVASCSSIPPGRRCSLSCWRSTG